MGATCGTLNCKTSKVSSGGGGKALIHIKPQEKTLEEQM
jgi:hypothetical protein